MLTQSKRIPPENVLKKAVRCNKDCACTKNDWHPCFKTGESVNDMILHIDEFYEENKMDSCRYLLPFGGEHYCICPVRLYIYKNFEV